MNELNSIIIEGTIKEISFCDLPSGKKVAQFVIAHKRFSTNESGERVENVENFNIEAWGNLSEIIEKNGKIDRGIRIVGRLSNNKVVAEHFEFRPMREKKQGVEDDRESDS